MYRDVIGFSSIDRISRLNSGRFAPLFLLCFLAFLLAASRAAFHAFLREYASNWDTCQLELVTTEERRVEKSEETKRNEREEERKEVSVKRKLAQDGNAYRFGAFAPLLVAKGIRGQTKRL